MKRKLAAQRIVICVILLLSACATRERLPPDARRFLDTLNRYPATHEQLRVRKLKADAFISVPQQTGPPRDVFIMVHPGYSLFFREENRSRYGKAKYALVSQQFDNEARFISEAASAGKIMILIVPGKYETDSIAPLSYTAYLNETASQGSGTFYLFSESSSSGSISMNDMVELYHFLQNVKARKILIGGGYIGRCQREFYSKLISFIDRSTIFIVPEISSISPDDVSEAESGRILESIKRQDYTPVKQFIDEKLDEVNFLSIPQKLEM